MAINEELTARVRAAFARLPRVEEKKMFRGIAFLVNGKLCVSAGNNELMLRIDPALHDEALQKPGTRTTVMKGKELKGYLYVHEDVLAGQTALEDWLNLALAFNAKAKASAKKK